MDTQQARFSVLMSNFFWALHLAWHSGPALVVTRTVLIFISGFVPALMALGIKGILDDVREMDQLISATPWLFIVPVILLANCLLQGIAGFVTARLSDELTLAVNQKMIEHASTLDLAFYENPECQDMLARAQQNSAYSCEKAVSDFVRLTHTVLQIVSLAIVVALIQPYVLLLIALIAVPYCVFHTRLSKSQYSIEHRRITKRRWTRYFISRLTNHANVSEIKLLGLGPILTRRFSELMAGFRNENRRIHILRMLSRLGFGLLFCLMICAVAYHTLSGAGVASIGSVAGLLIASERLFNSTGGFVSLLGRSVHSTMMISNLRSFLRVQPAASPPRLHLENSPAKHSQGKLEIRNLTFRYPGSDKPAVDDVSFTIHPGEVVSLVGKNGAGKTTLVKLLGKLYQPDRGKILLDDSDLNDLDDDLARSRMSFVMQSFNRYEATAGENIAYGDWARLQDDPEAIEEIARHTGTDEMIRQLPYGYDTRLGRAFGETTLSAGQWQSLVITRALSRNAPLLVLDEPTSNLDPKREYELFNEFRTLIQGRTALIVSHRFSTIRMADRILVMDQGRLVEEGSHMSLMASGGLYAQMFEMFRFHREPQRNTTLVNP